MTGDRGKRIASPPETAAIAVSLAKVAGWYVFPVTIYEDASGKRHKVPAVKWKDWATNDPRTIEKAWAGEHSGRWIGVYCAPSGIVVGDVDPGGDESIAAAGHTLPDTFEYPTHRKGGRHHVYAAPEGIELTIARGDDIGVPNVDVRAGSGLMVYYGPELTVAPELAPAPDWLIVTRDRPAANNGVDRAPSADEDAFRARLVDGKPDQEFARSIRNVEFPTNAAHEAMLEVVTALVAAGRRGAPGIAALLDETRGRYVGNHPERPRDWDNAVAGSVRRLGLPLATFPLTKIERREIKRRNTPEAVAQAKDERKAARVGALTKGDDIELAGLVSADLRGTLAYVSGAWREDNGEIWEDVSEAHVIELVRLNLEERGVDAYRSGDHDLAKYLKRGNTVTQTARLIRGPLERPEDLFDRDPDVLNTPSGVVDLRTGEVRARRPDDYFTKITRASKPGAPHEDWDKALEALPPKVRRYLQVRLGQAITGHAPDDDKVPFSIGDGSNGKTGIYGATLACLGSYASIMPAQLLESNPGDHPVAMMELHGCRFAVAEELRENHVLPMKRLKDIVGTDPMKARRLYGAFIQWKPTHSLFVTSNYQPHVEETDHGAWRRLLDIPFTYRFVAEPSAPDERQADPRLRSRLISGRGGRDEAVLAWLIEGARRWYDSGMVMPAAPKAVEDATTRWREQADVLFAFASDCLNFGPDAHVGASALLERLNEWLRARGEKTWTDVGMSAQIKKHELFRQHGVTKARPRFPDGTRPNLFLKVGLRPPEVVYDSFIASTAHNQPNR